MTPPTHHHRAVAKQSVLASGKFLATALFFCALAGFQTAQAAFELESFDARSVGWGGACAAVADTGDSLLCNPAGMAWQSDVALAASYQMKFAGIPNARYATNAVSLIVPRDILGGSFGLLWAQEALADFYQANRICLGYARILPGQWASVGAVGKIYTQEYLESRALETLDIFKSGNAVLGFSADIGAMLQLTPEFVLGLSLLDVLTPDMGLQQSDRVPWGGRAGLAYRGDDLGVALDAHWRSPESVTLTLGGEAWWLDHLLGVRAGTAWGNAQLFSASMGCSLILPLPGWELQMDYAASLPLSAFAPVGPNHVLTLTAAFPQWTGGGQEENIPNTSWKLSEDEQAEMALAEDQPAISDQEIISAALPASQAQMLEGKSLSPDTGMVLQQASPQKEKDSGNARLLARAEFVLAYFEKRLAKISERDVRRLQERFSGLKKDPRSKKDSEWLKQEIRLLVRQARRLLSKYGRRPRQASENQATPGATPTALPTPVAAEENVSRTAATQEMNPEMRKTARGAYGKAVKLLLDAEALQASKRFPEETAELKTELSGIKTILTAETYNEVIPRSEMLHARIEKLIRKLGTAPEKNKKGKVPLNW
jgi:hypothetical protein